MSVKYIAVVVALVLIGGVWFYLSDTAGRQPVTDLTPEVPPADAFVITLTTNGYEPADVTIKKGTAVTFVSETGLPHWPASNLHPSHYIYPEFDPLRPVDPDESWTFIFDKEGVWNFHDHMRAYYTGTIIVTDETN